jgi:Winged helix-turn-helix DNA-binding
MAVMDEVQRMQREVARRLKELEPLVSEYNELQKVAERLGVPKTDSRRSARSAGRSRRTATTRTSGRSAAGATKTPRAASQRATKARTTRGRRNAAAPGSRQQDVVRLVGERPGISVPDLGKELGVDPTGLYQIVRRLETRGVIRKDGRALRPVAATAEDVAGAAE